MKYINGYIIKIYNWIIGRKFINKNNLFCRRIRAILYHNICYECNATFGNKNADRKFYLIRCSQAEMGLFAVLNYIIYHLKCAEELGEEPVIDWQHYPNKYILEDYEIGKVNAWEYFFEKVSDIDLNDLYKSKNVHMSSGSWEIPGNEIFDKNKLWYSHEIWTKYIQLNAELNSRLDIEKERLGFNDYRILGVKCRGTDFIKARPIGHTIVPDIEMTIETINRKIEEWGAFDKIYLSTEDESIFKLLKDNYGNKLCYLEERRIILDTTEWLSEMYDRREVNNEICKKEDMTNYLIETYLLAECDALIAPQVGGTLGAMRIRGRYDYEYIFQLGVYK